MIIKALNPKGQHKALISLLYTLIDPSLIWEQILNGVYTEVLAQDIYEKNDIILTGMVTMDL